LLIRRGTPGAANEPGSGGQLASDEKHS